MRKTELSRQSEQSGGMQETPKERWAGNLRWQSCREIRMEARRKQGRAGRKTKLHAGKKSRK